MLDTWTHTHTHTQPESSHKQIISNACILYRNTDECARLGRTRAELWKRWWYFCISLGCFFFFLRPTSLICKVDFLSPSALSLDQNIHSAHEVAGGECCPAPPPHLDTLSLSDSPHARPLYSLRQEKERKKERKNKHQRRGRDIGYAHDAWCLQHSPKMGSVSRRCDVCVCVCVCVCVGVLFSAVWVTIWLTYLIHALWWFRAHAGKRCGWKKHHGFADRQRAERKRGMKKNKKKNNAVIENYQEKVYLYIIFLWRKECSMIRIILNKRPRIGTRQ